jgi:hypothetical protein
MDITRAVQELVARCVSIMVSDYNSGPSERANQEMVADVRAVAASVDQLSLGVQETAHNILRPVESELLARYGHELGGRIYVRFLAAVEGLAPPGPHPAGRRITVPDPRPRKPTSSR